jgi:hypothetical protein
MPLPVEHGHAEQELDILVVVIADIGGCPLRLRNSITLFPNPQSMGLDACEGLDVFNGEMIHFYPPGIKTGGNTPVYRLRL